MVFRLKALDHVGFNSVVGSGGLGFFFFNILYLFIGSV